MKVYILQEKKGDCIVGVYNNIEKAYAERERLNKKAGYEKYDFSAILDLNDTLAVEDF